MEYNRILIIDDDPNILQMISKVLGLRNYSVATSASGEEGLEKMVEFDPHLILLDFNLPGINGLEVLEKIREQNRFVSVIFLTAESTISNVIRGLDAGADDYISKPFVFGEFLARIRTHLRIQDLTGQLNTANNKLQQLVEIDDLTGLYNMRSVYQRIDKGLASAKNNQVAIFMMDMDSFKTVNDNHDHLFGSFVLAEVGKIIRSMLKDDDFGARFGGDEFMVFLGNTSPKKAHEFGEIIRTKIETNLFKCDDDEMYLTVSIGYNLSTSLNRPSSSKEFVRIADNALYQAKKEGRNRLILAKS